MANKSSLRTCLAISMFFLAMAGLAQAAAITVGSGASYDFDTIQAGIDAAVDGDTVLVAPGEYIITVPISFRGKAITVISEAGRDETTIRMGTPADPKRASVVIFENSETAASILDGFTITGGRGFWFPSVSAWGGGSILFNASSGTVRNCAMVQNHTEYGGGVACAYACSPTLIDCTIAENSAEKDGGGVFLWSGPSLTMTNCIISGNSAMGDTPLVAGYGGGLRCVEGSMLTLTDCSIAKNSAGVGGGGIQCWNDCLLTLINCAITENSAASIGGAMFCEQNSTVTMTNCIVSGNSAGIWAGGIHCYLNASLTMTNCEIINNVSQRQGGGLECSDGSSATLTNCLIARNSAAAWGGGLSCDKAAAFMTVNNCTILGNSAGQTGGGVGCDKMASAMVINSILWGNTASKGREISLVSGSTFGITYSNVAGGRTGINVEGGSTLNWAAGNINADPCFASPGYWADINDPNIVVEPDDPNAVWIDGDYHPKSEAGRWDPYSDSWVLDDVTSPCIDRGDPNSPVGDEPMPNGGIINMGAYGGTQEASMSPAVVYIQWLGHASVKIWTEGAVVYVDPRNLSESLHDATLVLVTHTHGDHYSPSDIARVSNPDTQFIAPPDVVQRYGKGQPIAPGQTIQLDGVSVTGVAAYNTNKPNHPKSRNWVGFVIELGSKRIYVAGDTDLTDEMKALEGIDVAILPVGGTYTMNAVEAAEATRYIEPELAIPYHWGDIIGSLSDAETFAQKAACAVKILTVGETISSDNWPEYSPLIAHWKLDETEGNIAHDSSGNYDGTLHGDPLWQSTGGKVDGALGFDGTDDYVNTDFVLNPADGAFSVFAWIKGGAPGQAVISQTGGVNWLSADASAGNLMTELRHIAGRVVGPPLWSQTVITDGDWHRVGFVWDGSNRILYADGAKVAADAQTGLGSSDGGLYIGTGKGLGPATFFSGLIDDIRIYNQALSAAEIAALGR